MASLGLGDRIVGFLPPPPPEDREILIEGLISRPGVTRYSVEVLMLGLITWELFVAAKDGELDNFMNMASFDDPSRRERLRDMVRCLKLAKTLEKEAQGTPQEVNRVEGPPPRVTGRAVRAARKPSKASPSLAVLGFEFESRDRCNCVGGAFAAGNISTAERLR